MTLYMAVTADKQIRTSDCRIITDLLSGKNAWQEHENSMSGTEPSQERKS